MATKLAGILMSVCMLGVWTGAHACPEPKDFCDAIRKTMDGFLNNTPAFANMKPTYGCKEISRNWVLQCLDLLPYVDPSPSKALVKISKILEGGAGIVVNGQVLLEAVSRDDIEITEGCCKPLCELGKLHCGCHKFVWDVVAELMGGDATIAEKIVEKTTTKCLAKEGFDFKAPIIGSNLCEGTRKEHLKTSKSWTCGA